MAQEQESGSDDQSARWRNAAALVVCAAALLYTIWPLREAYRSWNDFRFVYVAGLNWLRGISPYDFEAWVANWRGVPHDFLAGPPTQPFVYPPHWALLAVPLAALPWHWATRIWDVVSVAAFAATVALCGSMLGRGSWSRPALWLLAAAATFSGVVRYALWESQMGLLPLLGVVGAVSAWRRGSPRALAAFAFVAALKPQIAALPLLFLLLNGGHAGVLRGGLVAVAVSVAAMIPVGLSRFPAQFHRCLRLHMGAGFNQRDNFTNLSVLWAHLDGADAWFWVSPALALAAIALLTMSRRRSPDGPLAAMLDDPLWLLSLLASLSAALLPLHRYDLVIYTPVFFLALRIRPLWLSLALVALVEAADRPHLLDRLLGHGAREPWLTLGVALLCTGTLVVNQGDRRSWPAATAAGEPVGGDHAR